MISLAAQSQLPSPPAGPPGKRCRTCRKSRFLTDFPIHRRSKDGRRTVCEACLLADRCQPRIARPDQRVSLEFTIYKGEKFWVQSHGRYFQSGKKSAEERLLHRRVYAENYGPIPRGFHVHHRDGNWRNNAPENLELISAKEHGRQHMSKRIAQDPARNAANLAKAQEAARAWHCSPEGRAWHQQHSKRCWIRRQTHTRSCKRCGAEFATFWPNKAKCCSRRCTMALSYKRYFDDARTCAGCSQPFLANRHRKTRFCSPACSVKHAPRGFARPRQHESNSADVSQPLIALTHLATSADLVRH